MSFIKRLNKKSFMNKIDLKDFIISKLEEKKAEEIKVFQTKNLNIAPYIIVANGRSMKNVSALADYISNEIKNKVGIKISLEGTRNSNWAVLDMQQAVLHIFHPEARTYYDVDSLFENQTSIATLAS